MLCVIILYATVSRSLCRQKINTTLKYSKNKFPVLNSYKCDTFCLVKSENIACCVSSLASRKLRAISTSMRNHMRIEIYQLQQFATRRYTTTMISLPTRCDTISILDPDVFCCWKIKSVKSEQILIPRQWHRPSSRIRPGVVVVGRL